MNSNENRECSMDTLYQQLTGIHVGEHLDEWDARGKGYYGEFLLFAEFPSDFRCLPRFAKQFALESLWRHFG